MKGLWRQWDTLPMIQVQTPLFPAQNFVLALCFFCFATLHFSNSSLPQQPGWSVPLEQYLDPFSSWLQNPHLCLVRTESHWRLFLEREDISSLILCQVLSSSTLKYFFNAPTSSLEKWLVIGLGWEIYKMSLRHLVESESKKVLKKKKKRWRANNMGRQNTTTNWRDSQWPKLEHSEQENK